MLSNKQWEDKPSPQIKEYNKLSNEEVPWDLAENNWNRENHRHKKITMKCNLSASISYFQNNQFNSSNYLQAGWTKMLQVPFSYEKTSCQLMMHS